MKEINMKTNQITTKSTIHKYSDKFTELLNKATPPPSSYNPQQKQNQEFLIKPSHSPPKHPQQQYQFVAPPKSTEYFFYRVKSIGVGAHSFVYLIQEEQTKCLYAQKAITKSHAEKHQKQLSNEIKIQSQLSHDNLISLYHFYSDNSYIYLVMEFAEESLFNLKQKFNIFKEKEVIEILRQSLHALAYIHRQGFVHADIKIQNLMIRNGRVKLCDFGYAYQYKAEQKINQDQIVGTLEYLSPEYAQGTDSGPMRDIWALGILCFELWTGKNPFEHLKQNEKWLSLVKPDFNLFAQELDRIDKEENRKSAKIEKIIRHTLCPVEQRYSASNLLGMEFFNSVPSTNSSHHNGTQSIDNQPEN